MKLQLSTWQEVSSYLERKQIVLLPIGSTEQHGPNGFIGTDALCPEAVAAEVGRRNDILVGPTLSIGMAQHHLGFPGSIALRPSTIITMLVDIVNSLSRNGFREFYFLNGHGGNIATISAAFSEIHAQASFAPGEKPPSVRCRQRNWWDGSGVSGLSRQLFGSSDGSHATCSEVSLTYFLYPDHIKQAVMDPPIAPEGPIYDALDFAGRFKDGRMGSNPALANSEAGEKLFNAAVKDVEQDIVNAFGA